MVSIRRATVDDAAVIAEIGKQSFFESHGHSAAAADVDAYAARKFTVDAVQAELAPREHIYHLVFYNDVPAGYSKIVLNAPNENIPAANITCLDRLYLLKAFYGVKLGLALFEHNLDISKQSGQAGMWLYTWIENARAIAFYEKAGFKIVGKADFKLSETHSNPNHVMYLEYSG